MTGTDSDAEFERQIDAVLWFIEHPESLEAMKDEILKAYIKHIKKRVESEEAVGTLPPSVLVIKNEKANE